MSKNEERLKKIKDAKKPFKISSKCSPPKTEHCSNNLQLQLQFYNLQSTVQFKHLADAFNPKRLTIDR